MAAKEYSLDILDARIDINAAIIVGQRADRRRNRYHPIRGLSARLADRQLSGSSNRGLNGKIEAQSGHGGLHLGESALGSNRVMRHSQLNDRKKFELGRSE